MSVRRLRAELRDLRSRIERQRQPVFVFFEHGETEEQALKRAGVDPEDPTINVSFVVGTYPEERGI